LARFSRFSPRCGGSENLSGPPGPANPSKEETQVSTTTMCRCFLPRRSIDRPPPVRR
jgi:hypothetical protein